jgi:Fe2+ or Zn2+ uptake regulation protein
MKNLLIVKEILNSNGIPITPLRLLCLRSIIQFKAPFTVQQLVSDLRWETKINASVARRTLSLYSKMGLVSKTESEVNSEVVILRGRKKRQRDVNYQWIGQINSLADRDETLRVESISPDPNPTCL